MTTDTTTSEGKRIAARNATTHGLFARDVVLPRLGEDPKAYERFLAELTAQLNPKNLLEQHYAEKITPGPVPPGHDLRATKARAKMPKRTRQQPSSPRGAFQGASA